MTKARELYACNKCGKYPIEKIVEIGKDQLAIEPQCPECGGETHFEKVREVEEVCPKPISLFEHCRRESGLTDSRQIKTYMNRHYGYG